MTWTLFATQFILALGANAADPRASFKNKCLGFKPRTHVAKDAVLNHLEYVPAGTTLALPDADPSCNRALGQAVAVDLCRVTLSVPTSSRSGIHLELWLPEAWNGRTLATGNGGLDGCWFICGARGLLGLG